MWNNVWLTFRDTALLIQLNLSGHWSLMQFLRHNRISLNLWFGIGNFFSLQKFQLVCFWWKYTQNVHARIRMSLNSDTTIIHYQTLLLQTNLCRRDNKWSNNESKSKILIIFFVDITTHWNICKMVHILFRDALVHNDLSSTCYNTVAARKTLQYHVTTYTNYPYLSIYSVPTY